MRGLYGVRPDFQAHDHSLVNVIRGLVERIYNVKRKDTGQLTRPPQALPGARRRLRRCADKLLNHMRQPIRMAADEFIQACPSRLRSKYRNAHARYLREGMTERDAWIKLFIKFEKHNLTKKGDPCPRNIQPRDPVYNLRLGMFLRPLEKQMYDCIAYLWGDALVNEREHALPVVMKGMNAEETAAAMVKVIQDVDANSTEGWVAIGADASRFDQHVGEEMLKYEHSLYLRAYENDPEISELRWLLKQQLKTKGKTYCQDESGEKYQVKYTTGAQRCSGDINTGLGNCILMCSLMYVYFKEVLGIKNVRLINNGDDAVIILGKEDQRRYLDAQGTQDLLDWFKEMGFTMELEEPVDVIEQIEFCQQHLVRTIDGWIMCPKPDSMGKYAVALVDQSKVDAWISELGIAGRQWGRGMPMFHAYFSQFPETRRMSHNDNQWHGSGFYWNTLGLSARRHVITPEARLSMWLATNITPREQIEFEKRCLRSQPDYNVGQVRKFKTAVGEQIIAPDFSYVNHHYNWHTPWGFED